MEIGNLEGQILAERFELAELIGEGGYGAVFRAVQLSVERPCAVKILSPELCTEQNTVERFKNEARMTARLTHEHTVRIIDFGRDDDKSVIFLAMELLDGEPVKDIVEQTGPMDVDEVLKIVDEASESLREAHDRGMVHRDIKPHNIMLIRRRGDDRFVKVIDFGIAKALENELTDKDDLTRTGMMIGTPTYMAPEQIRAGDMDGRTDQYALAMTIYHMLTGRTPFQGSTSLEVASKHLTEPPLPLSSYRPNLEVPDSFDQVLLKALEKDKEDRFATIIDFAEALRASAEGRLEELTAVDVPKKKAHAGHPTGSGSGPAPQPQSGPTAEVGAGQPDEGSQSGSAMPPQTGEISDGRTMAADSAEWRGSSQEVVGPQDTSDVPQAELTEPKQSPGGNGSVQAGADAPVGDQDWETAATRVAAMDEVSDSNPAPAPRASAPTGQTAAQPGVEANQGGDSETDGPDRRVIYIAASAAAVVALVGLGLLGAYVFMGGGGESEQSGDPVAEAPEDSRKPSGAKASAGGESAGSGADDKGDDDGADDRAKSGAADDEQAAGGGDEAKVAGAGESNGEDGTGAKGNSEESTDKQKDDGAEAAGGDGEESSGQAAADGAPSSEDQGAQQGGGGDEPSSADRPTYGSVRVIVIPWGRVYVGGRSLGQSSGGPLQTQLPVGHHTLVLKQRGEVKAKSSVRVRENGQAKVVLRAR